MKLSKHQLFIISAISLSVFFLGYFSPQISAIVEPSITIVMGGGQTTYPVTIYDSNEDVVFSVDTNGVIFPSQGSPTLLYNFIYENYNPITVTATDDIDNPIVLAMWDISTNGTTQRLGLMGATNNGVMEMYGQTTSGIGYVMVLWEYSENSCGTSIESDFFNGGLGNGFNSVTPAWKTDDASTWFYPEYNCVRIVAYNDDSATSGTVEQVMFAVSWQIPSYFTITRVI